MEGEITLTFIGCFLLFSIYNLMYCNRVVIRIIRILKTIFEWRSNQDNVKGCMIILGFGDYALPRKECRGLALIL